PARDRDREHGGEPAPDVRDPRPRERDPPPAAGAPRVRARARPDRLVARGAPRAGAGRAARSRARRADRGQPGCDRAPLRPPSRLGLPLAPHGAGVGGMSALGQAVSRPRLVPRVRQGEAAWARPALAALLVGTAVLYLAGLSRNGWGNAYYTAAVQASTHS